MASSAKRKRFTRRDVRGTEGVWEVNAAGNVYKYDRLQPVGESAAGPTINFGHRYINETLVVPAYLGPVPSTGRRTDTCRLLDEIVCFAFHGYPPGGFSGSGVEHLDSDSLNCAAENVRWELDDEYALYVREMATMKWMRPDFLPRHRRKEQPVPSKVRKELNWVEALNLPGRMPVEAA